jgi:hypothetical protein
MNKQAIIFTMLALVTLGLVAQPPRSYKRGVSENNFTRAEEINSLARGVTWFYNWGNLPNSPIAGVVGPGTDMEYVPMIWSANFDEARLRAYLTEHPGVKYLLGYNEPNFRAQANMTPDSAAALWPIVEKIAEDFNLKLVAPALNYSGEALSDGKVYQPNEWMDAFLAAYPDAHFDYLALHCYMNSNVGQINYVENFAKRYGKQVWLTEFCAWEGNVDSTTQKRTMVQKIQDLELSPYVYRYAWFKAKGSNSAPYYRLLINQNMLTHEPPVGTLSGAGKIYLNMSSFDTTYYWLPAQVIPAKDYVYSQSIAIDLNSDPASQQVLQINEFDVYARAEYLIEIPVDGKYDLRLRLSSRAFLSSPQIRVFCDGEVVADQVLPVTGMTTTQDVWKTQMIQNIPLTAGKHRIELRSARSTTCKVNWLRLDLCGDINGDMVADIADVNAAINVMLGKQPASDVADQNGDGKVDIADVNAVINTMLGK